MEDDQPTSAGRRRSRGTAATARSEALSRLKSLCRGERRSGSSYQINLEEPIYDTVDEDEYNKRCNEFRSFIVDDGPGAGNGDLDVGEEEDWTKSGLPDWSDESDGGESERPKRRKQEKEEDSQVKKPPPSSLSAAAALIGKPRIYSMFNSSVFKKREDKGEALVSSDSIVEGLIAEFTPDEIDRENRRREQSRSVGLGQMNSYKVGNSVNFSCRLQGDVGLEKRPEAHDSSTMNFEPKEASVLDIGDNVPKDDEGFSMVWELSETAENGEMKAETMPEDEKAKPPQEVQHEVKLVANEEEDKVNPGLKEKEEKVFSLNAKIKETKDNSFSASAELQALGCSENGSIDSSEIGDNAIIDSVEKSEFVLEPDGSLPFYVLDAHEETYGANMGTIHLFGKVKAGNTYQSCCVVVKNIQRCVYAFPNSNIFLNEEVLKIEKDVADSRITPAAFRTKLHDVASGLKTEISKHLLDLNISKFSMAPVKGSYAFDRPDVPIGENYVLKITYPYKDPPLPSDLKGGTFSAVLGTHSSALELFLIKRKIKGPSWLSLSKFSCSSSHQRVSWCKFEITVDCSKDIQVSASTQNTAEIPPLIVTSINLKTVINPKQNVHEIISVSIISCNKAKIDTPMLPSEWKRRGILRHFTVTRKLEGGIFPIGFAKKVSDKNAEAQSNVLASESSERALLNRLMIELYKLDSDVLVGHNISGFDLDILLHRAQACRVPSSMWSKLGRLKRSVMPKLSKGSNVFGSGASSGIMTCMAGRLLCDTFLCSRDLLKEVSYSLTQLAKTQLNKDRKEIAPHDIPNMFQTTESLMELIECNETDAWLSMELMFHLSILPLTRQLTNISGNLWGKTLQGARAQRVEYLLLHAFHARKYIVPDKYSSHERDTRLSKRKVHHGNDTDKGDATADNEAPLDHNGKGKKAPAYAGGLVLEPKNGLYDKYILLLDFNSLYPSIIQEYNICFTTVERSSDGSHLPSSKRTGVLPELLKSLVERRRMVKSWMKKSSGLKVQQLDIQQQALKLTANSMYGCLGFSDSRFYAKSLAELITSQGREILQSTVDLVQNNLNLEVIYGDTDSIMIYSGLDDVAKCEAIAGKVIKEVNKKYRCLEIDLDGLYKRMLLLKKKKYAAVKVQFKDGTTYEVIEQKGLDMVRRDWSLLSKEMGDFCLSQILSGGSCEDVVESIHDSQKDMRKGEVALEKYVITKSLTKPPEAYPDAKNQPHVQVALRLKQSGYSSGCSSGDTVPYVICCEEGGSSGTSAGIAQRARHPDELKKDNGKWMIDIDYYLSQQIHPVVSRLCACIQGTSPARLADCLGLDSSKFQSKTAETVSDDPSGLLLSSADEERYQDCEPLSLSCPSCSSSFECPSVFQYLCKAVNNKGDNPTEDTISKFWLDLRCPKCPDKGNIGTISPAMIANQVKRQADDFISKYYMGLMTCDDETCKYTTRSFNLRVIGDSESGTICPNYPHCNGHLVRKYAEADLYRQLSYFCHLLDTTRYADKVDVNARMLIEKELARARPFVDLAAMAARKMRDRCAYGWVQLQSFFVTV